MVENEKIVEQIKTYLFDNLSTLEELNKETITKFREKEDALRKEITDDEKRTKMLHRIMKNSEEELIKNNSLIQQITSKIDSKNVTINSPDKIQEIRKSFFSAYLAKFRVKQYTFAYKIMEYIYNNYLFNRLSCENNEEHLLNLSFFWFTSHSEYMSHIFILGKIINSLENLNENSLKEFKKIYENMKIEKDYSKVIINEPLLYVFEFLIYTFIKLFCTKSKKEINESVKQIYNESEKIIKLNYGLNFCGFWKIEFCKSFYDIFEKSLNIVPLTLSNLYPEKIEDYDIYIFKKKNMNHYCRDDVNKTNKFKEAIVKYFMEIYFKYKNIALLKRLLEENELIPSTKLFFTKILQQTGKISLIFKGRSPDKKDEEEKVNYDIQFFIENKSSNEILKLINQCEKKELDSILSQSFSDIFKEVQDKQTFLHIIFLNINKYLIKKDYKSTFLYHLACFFFKSYLETYFKEGKFQPTKKEIYKDDGLLEKTIRKYLELELPKMNLEKEIKNEVKWKFDLFLNFLYDYPMNSIKEDVKNQNWGGRSIESDDPYTILTTIKKNQKLNLIYFDYFVNNKLTSNLSFGDKIITLPYYKLISCFLEKAQKKLDVFLPNFEMLLYSIKIYWYCAFKTKSYYHLFYEDVKKLLESNYIPGRKLYQKQKEWDIKDIKDIKDTTITPEKMEAAKKKIEEMKKIDKNNQTKEEMLKAFVLILNKYKESDKYSIPLTLGEEEDEEKYKMAFSYHVLNFINYSIIFCSKLLKSIQEKDCAFLFMDEDCIRPLKINWNCIKKTITDKSAPNDPDSFQKHFHNFLNSFFEEVFGLESEEIKNIEKKREFETKIDQIINKLVNSLLCN